MADQLSIQCHPHILPSAWPTPGGAANRGEPALDWAALAPRLVHPAWVAILEALFYVGHPLSAAELRALFDEPESYCLSIVSSHLAKLTGYGVLAEMGSRQVRGETETYYFLPSWSNRKVPG